MAHCRSCETEYEAANQHSQCPKCGKALGTKEQDSDTLPKFVKWVMDWETHTQDAREESERDHDYYHGHQWTPEEVEVLNQRGQPVVTKNRIFKKVNFLLGNEIRNRTDPKALPRTPAHDHDVDAITDAIRYVVDDNDFDQIASRAWSNQLIEGYAGAVVEHEVLPTKDIEVRIRRVPWDRLWFDIHSREADFADAAYLGITTWYHLDDAIAEFAKHPHAVEDAVEIIEGAVGEWNDDNDTLGDKPRWVQGTGADKRVRVEECFYRTTDEQGQTQWMTCRYVRNNFVIEPRLTGQLDLEGRNVCPLLMTSAFVTRDGVRYGLVRHMISAQDEINKRSSKMLHHLSTDRMTFEEGAVADIDEARNERAKPDGVVQVQRKALAEGRILFEKGLDMAQGQSQLLQEAKLEIDTIGPEIPQIGSVGANASGRALQQRQQIGSLELAPLEDNHRRWKRQIYEHCYLRIRQYWRAEKWVRVRDDVEKTGYRFVGLNRPMTKGERFRELIGQEVPPESALTAVGLQPMLLQQTAAQLSQSVQASGQQVPPEQMQALVLQAVGAHPLMRGQITASDVAGIDVDILIEESPDVSIIQQEEQEQLAALVPSFLQTKPEMASTLLEMVIEAGQLRAKRKLLDMMRKPPDPQQQQMQQAQAQIQMQQMQLSLAQMQAQVQALQSQAGLNQAKSQQAQADAAHTMAETQAIVPADSQLKQAQAMKAAADAGDKTGALR